VSAQTDDVTAAASADLFCPNCGYSLRGITSPRCPECGHELDWKTLGVSRIPWVHRRAIGAIKAYWRTVWLTMLDSRAIADDVHRPVSFEDAQRFRRITVMLAWLPLAAAATVGFFAITFEMTNSPLDVWDRGTAAQQFAFVLEWLMLPIGWLSLYLFLRAITGVQSYFFHPRSLPVIRQNRAVALSYYACAPLAWTPVTSAAIAIWIVIAATGTMDRSPLLLVIIGSIVVFGLLALQTVGWWLNTMRLLRRTTQCGEARVWTMGFVLPATWFLLLVIVAAGIPAAYGFVCLVVLSLL
jgi:hypothetical protein